MLKVKELLRKECDVAGWPDFGNVDLEAMANNYVSSGGSLVKVGCFRLPADEANPDLEATAIQVMLQCRIA